MCCEGRDDRYDAVYLLFFRNGIGTGACRFATDVNNIRAFPHELLRLRDCHRNIRHAIPRE